MDKHMKYMVPDIFKGAMTVLVLLVFISPGFVKGGGGGTPMAPYCAAPPFVSTSAAPNILIQLDNSGSMNWKAYDPLVITIADLTDYYGYFKPESLYDWDGNHWESSPAGTWPGRILNWACMSRADVAKKVLTGGKGNIQGPIARLTSEGTQSYNKIYQRDKDNYNTFIITHTAPGVTQVQITKTGLFPPINATQVQVSVIVDIPEEEYRGVLDQIGDKNDDRHWDDDAPLFGLWHYNDNEGGYIRDYLGDPDIIDLRNHVNNMESNGWTPLAESYFEILHYVSQADAYYFQADYTENPGGLHDPFYDKHLHDMVSCRRMFVLMITDGESTQDQNIPDSDPTMPACNRLQTYYDGIDPQLPSGGTDYLDDVTLYGHVNDMRPDRDWGSRNLEGDQSVKCYIIYAFGTLGSNLLMEAAKTGGFKDSNGDSLPDLQSEWDEDGDSIPDNYYEATSGYELEDAIMSAIMEMLETITSGSSVGVVAMGSSAGGGTAQAQFWPRKTISKTEELSWIGTVNSYWLDPFGWLREDTDPDAILHLQNDLILNMMYVPSENNVMVHLIQDVAGTGDPDQFDTLSQVPIEEVTPIWDGGQKLWLTPAEDRLIGTFVDADTNGFVDAGEIKFFIPGQASLLRPYLGCETDAEADSLIRWIRGTDYSNKRNRTAKGNVWKLGDIINSGASAIQKPIERYDFIYGDITYGAYYDLYRNSRQVVFVGGNDGMLHCFNAGIPEQLDGDPMMPFRYNADAYALGEEIWGYIPFNLLPHLQWLPDLDYCHVYYVDLKPYVTDVQIFLPPDPVHPNGWGALLIGGMRFGGMPIENEKGSYSSAFFAMDVTEPLVPKPMWEFRHPDLDLTLCYPTVVKVADEWFLVFGTGPVTSSGEADQPARIMVLRLATGEFLHEWILPDDNSFISNIFGADWGMDYTVDRLYFGTCYYLGPPTRDWKGKIYRILTNDDVDPTNWDLAMVFDADRPITGEGSIATDDYNHLWVYFGTGRFYSDVDEADQTIGRYVGFRDDTTRATTVSGLYNVTNVWIDTLGEVHGAGTITDFQVLIDTITAIGGWWRQFEDLGERNLTTTLVFGGAVLFTTYVPTGDLCSYGGEGYLYALYYRTGTAYVAGTDKGNTPFLQQIEGAAYPEKVFLGYGMPSEPSLYVSPDETKVFVQAGGAILTPVTGIPGLPETGVLIWKSR